MYELSITKFCDSSNKEKASNTWEAENWKIFMPKDKDN